MSCHLRVTHGGISGQWQQRQHRYQHKRHSHTLTWSRHHGSGRQLSSFLQRLAPGSQSISQIRRQSSSSWAGQSSGPSPPSCLGSSPGQTPLKRCSLQTNTHTEGSGLSVTKQLQPIRMSQLIFCMKILKSGHHDILTSYCIAMELKNSWFWTKPSK